MLTLLFNQNNHHLFVIQTTEGRKTSCWGIARIISEAYSGCYRDFSLRSVWQIVSRSILFPLIKLYAFLQPQQIKNVSFSNIPASFFYREAQVLLGAWRTKSCLSETSSFCLVEKSAGVGKKKQDGSLSFLLSFFFLLSERKKVRMACVIEMLIYTYRISCCLSFPN